MLVRLGNGPLVDAALIEGVEAVSETTNGVTRHWVEVTMVTGNVYTCHTADADESERVLTEFQEQVNEARTAMLPEDE